MSTTFRVPLWGFLAIVFAFVAVAARADDRPATGDEDIAGWVKDLDSEKFSTRDQATGKLTDAGERAINAVAAAALSESREVSTRSIDILKRLMSASDKSTKDKAKAALEKLAQGTNEAAARRATQALKPTPAIPVPAANPFGQIQIGGGGIQVQGNVQIGAGGNRTIKIQNINGRKTIEVNDNGKKIEIVEDPQQGIDVSITEKVNGQDKTEKYAAKDADELKKKHPEAAKVYEQYKGGRIGGGVIAIQVQAGGVPGVVPNILPQQFLPNVPRAPQQAATPIAEARKLLGEAAEQLKKQASENAALQKAFEQVQAADRKLAEAEEKLGK